MRLTMGKPRGKSLMIKSLPGWPMMLRQSSKRATCAPDLLAALRTGRKCSGADANNEAVTGGSKSARDWSRVS